MVSKFGSRFRNLLILKSILKFILIVWCSLTYGLSSQSKIEVGLRVIPQRTSIRYTSEQGNKYDFQRAALPKYFAPHNVRNRVAFGIGILYNPIKRFRMGVDLLYSMQGGGYAERKTNLNYLKTPLWLGYNSSPKRKVIFTLQSGIELSFLLTAKTKFSDRSSTNIRNSLTKINLGIPFAIGLKFKIHSSYFLTTQLYLYSDLYTLSKTNKTFGAYNFIYPGLRIAIDRNLLLLKNKNK